MIVPTGYSNILKLTSDTNK